MSFTCHIIRPHTCRATHAFGIDFGQSVHKSFLPDYTHCIVPNIYVRAHGARAVVCTGFGGIRFGKHFVNVMRACLPACRVYWVYDGLVGWVVSGSGSGMSMCVCVRVQRSTATIILQHYYDTLTWAYKVWYVCNIGHWNASTTTTQKDRWRCHRYFSHVLVSLRMQEGMWEKRWCAVRCEELQKCRATWRVCVGLYGESGDNNCF